MLFSIEEIITRSWNQFKNAPVFWIGITLFSLIMSSLGNVTLLLTIISIYFSSSICLMYINYIRNMKVSIDNLTSINLTTFIHYIFVNICCGVAVLCGLFFFIIPGIYLATRLMFAQYLVVDEKRSFDDAIKTSWKMTQEQELNLFVFLLAMCLLIITGACVFLVGLLVAMPLANLCGTNLYLIFKQRHAELFSDDLEKLEQPSITDVDFE